MAAIAPSIHYYRTRDSQRLAVRIWDHPDPLGEVVYVHGIVSHGGWYLSSCDELASRGFRVHFLERRGSGLNLEQSGDVDHWQTWLSDVQCYMELLPSDRPRVLLGISWGGILATAFARHHGEMIAGLGLICPGLFSRKAANRWQRAGLRVAKLLGLSNQRVEVPLKDPALFTHSSSSQRYVAQDPLALRKITIRFAIENQKLLQEATSHPDEIRVPVLLMLAGRDPITDNLPTRHFVSRIGHPSQTIIEYPDASHTLEFEDDPTPYFEDLAQWCKSIVNR